MKRELKFSQLLPAILLPLAVGALAAFLTKDGILLFPVLKKPPLSPPAWLFAPVWTVLYILMGIASAQVWGAGVSLSRRDRALGTYTLNLAANFVWPLLFFGLELFSLAFFWLLLLWIIAAICTLLFWYIDQRAGKLMLPYMLWLSFAAYLNLGIWLLNR